jgi:DNA-binding MarR family transcriptional regulator
VGNEAAPPSKSLEWGFFDGRLGPVVRLVRNELVVRVTEAQAPFGLRFGTLSTMVLVDANPGCSQADLARELAIDKSMLVSIVDDLEAQGLATRTRSPEDRRRNSLTLTAEGRRVMHEMLEASGAVEQPIRDAMSREELETLIDLLKRAYTAMVGSGPRLASSPAGIRRETEDG